MENDELRNFFLKDFYYSFGLVFDQTSKTTERIQKLGSELSILFLLGWIALFIKKDAFPLMGIISCGLHVICLLLIVYLLWDNIEVGEKAMDSLKITHPGSGSYDQNLDTQKAVKEKLENQIRGNECLAKCILKFFFLSIYCFGSVNRLCNIKALI